MLDEVRNHFRRVLEKHGYAVTDRPLVLLAIDDKNNQVEIKLAHDPERCGWNLIDSSGRIVAQGVYVSSLLASILRLNEKIANLP